MKFIDETQEQAYTILIERMGNNDVYHKALAYLITVDTVCRKHIDSIYDFADRCINPDCLADSWQTGTSIKTCRLAFSLYNGSLVWCPEEDHVYVTPSELFCCSLAPYYWEAIKIRYPEYTEE